MPTYVKKNAIKILNTDSLDGSIYEKCSAFKVLMVGEMHGTNEPASLVMALARLLTSGGEKISVGFEICSEDLNRFLTDRTDSNLYHSKFFSKKAIDGRENQAWANLILFLNKNKNVELFFYDINQSDYKNTIDRDSLMYLNIKKHMLKFPDRKVITLSGNIHNMIEPFRGKNTMASYLRNDPDLKLSEGICAINHRYASGTMMNNGGNGLQLREVKSPDSAFSTSVGYDSYLLFFPFQPGLSHNAIYFTRKVSAAKILSTN